MNSDIENNSNFKRAINTIGLLEVRFLKILSSKNFLWFILLLFILQSLWLAVSLLYPMLFDEMFHFGVVRIYSKQLSPFITNQPEMYDTYGYLTFGSASIYHYILSFPYRLLSIFIDSQTALIISLRIINIALACLGIWIFNLVFKKIGIKQIFINIALLFYILIPIVTFASATISYDNLLLPLTALFLLLGVNILITKKIYYKDYLIFFIVGMFTALVKFTFLPLFLVGLLYVAINAYIKHKASFIGYFIKTFKDSKGYVKWLLTIMFVITFSMLCIRYITPVLLYKTPIPSCAVALGETRCVDNNVSLYEMNAKATKNERQPEVPQQYILTWIKTILLQLDTSASVTSNGVQIGKSIPVFAAVMSFGVLFGISVLLFSWQKLDKNIGWYFLISILATLVISVIAFSAFSYYSVNLDINTQARYIISVLPIGMVMAVISLNRILNNARTIKVLLLISALTLSTQGGGIIKPLLNANDSWYWDNQTLRNINKDLKNHISPFVDE